MTKRARLSVFDTSGIVEFAKGLIALGFVLDATPKTKELLASEGILVGEASDAEYALICTNLAPVTLAQVNSAEEAINAIEEGELSLLRAASKHYGAVLVVTDAHDYQNILAQLKKGDVSQQERLALAIRAIAYLAAYDATTAQTLQALSSTSDIYPERLTLTYERVQRIRYGENPHQTAAFYREPNPPIGALCHAEQISGKELSYNNLSDAHTAVDILREFSAETPCAVVVKHANPAGVGIGDNLYDAFVRAHHADPVSISGAIVAVNQKVDVATAKLISGIFIEILIAPDFEEEALLILTQRQNLRILRHPNCLVPNPTGTIDAKSVVGGLLVQQLDTALVRDDELEVVTRRSPSEEEMRQLRLAMRVIKHVKSNAICLAKDDRIVGVGAGQTKRVTAVDIAVSIAGERARGSVMASDAFITLPECITHAAEAGIVAIIQPGGSVRDQESIDACNKAGIAMVFTGIRHFKH